MTEKKLLKLLRYGTDDCEFKKAFCRAFRPFIPINPYCKASLIWKELQREAKAKRKKNEAV